MPIPRPRDGETQREFVNRCMANETMLRDYPDESQRAAICHQAWREPQNQMATVNHCISNVSYRTERWEGEEYLVVPIVAMVEGVHVGSAGPGYYPLEEIEKFPEAWNGVPLPVFHPRDNGTYVSANSPEIISSQTVGRFFNAHFHDGKLKGEGWISIKRAREIAPEILDIIRSNGRLEISTGLYSDHEERQGTWGEEEYEFVVRNIRPDHIALLPGHEGACSWEDGCGVRANEKTEGEDMEINIRSTARRPSYTGTESRSWAGISTGFRDYRDAYYRTHGGRPDDPVTRVADAPAAMKRWIASKTLLGDGSADNERDLIFFPVVNPSNDRLNEGALRAVISGRGAQARIPDAAKRSAQNMARRLLNEEFDADLELQEARKEKSRLLADILLNETSHDEVRTRLQQIVDEYDTHEAALLHFVVDVYDDYFIYEARQSGQPSKFYRQEYRTDADGQVELVGDPVEVVRETTYVEAQERQRSLFDNKKTEGGKTMTKDERKKAIDDLIANERTPYSDEDREFLEKLADPCFETLQKTVEKFEVLVAQDDSRNKGEEQKGGGNETDPDQTTNASSEAEPSDGDGEEFQSADEFLEKAKMPDEIKANIQRALQRDRQEKARLIEALVKNPRNVFTREQLEAKELPELEGLAKLADVPKDYSLRSGGRDDQADAPVLGLPTLNFQAKS